MVTVMPIPIQRILVSNKLLTVNTPTPEIQPTKIEKINWTKITIDRVFNCNNKNKG